MKVFTAQQMRDFDRDATEKYSVPSAVLMENAALRVVEFLEQKFVPLHEKKSVILCGKGNNGGDGFAIARHLLSAGCQVKVLLACPLESLKGDAFTNFKTLQNTTDSSLIIQEESAASTLLEEDSIDFIIDALLGTGFSGETVRPPFSIYLQKLNRSRAISIAIDIPSALDADSGAAIAETVRADYTVTFAAPKRGMFLREGPEKCGEIWVGGIGTPMQQLQATHTGCQLITLDRACALAPHRKKTAHKGDAGRVLLIGGSLGMSGAPILSAQAALKSGAGLCIAALPETIIPIFASAFPEATSHPLPCSKHGTLLEATDDELAPLWKNAQATAIGPGIGRDESTFHLVQRTVRECPCPLVIDADALYALRSIESDLKNRELPTVLTPHPGEMSELMQITVEDIQEARIETALACAQKYNAIVVLKGAYSIIAHPDGQTAINLTGNPGMATGGSGDILTGIIASMSAQQGKTDFDTVLFSVYLHGFAGDLAFAEKGNGLIAGDIADFLPAALRALEHPPAPSSNARLQRLR